MHMKIFYCQHNVSPEVLAVKKKKQTAKVSNRRLYSNPTGSYYKRSRKIIPMANESMPETHAYKRDENCA